MSKFYITTALAYVNASPHMGHAFQFVRSDAIARYRRLKGDDVWFLTGTDEYGSKLYKTAQKQGITPQKLVNKNAKTFKEIDKLLNISYNDFIRTTDKKRHWPGAQLIWRKLRESGDLYKAQYKGYYCFGCEAYINVKELKDGKCVYHDTIPESLDEENYFFRLSKYADKLKRIIENNEIEIVPQSRQKEALNIIEEGLRDVSFSRPKKILPWGIPVPNDESHVMYVWCDALTNYISALGYGSGNLGKLNKYWPADVHVIGKDNLRFHALYWPAMLMSAGLALPKQIYIHGFLTSGGQKMSKTIGNVVSPLEVAGKYGAEPLRYYLLKEIPVVEDGDFTIEHFEEVYNADLANGLGNTLARVLAMAEKYSSMNQSADSAERIMNYESNTEWKEIINVTRECVDYALNSFNTPQALAGIWHILRKIDEDIDKTKPWELCNNSESIRRIGGKNQELHRLLFNWLGALWNVGNLLKPFLPETAEKIFKQLGFEEKRGFSVKKGDILFPKI